MHGLLRCKIVETGGGVTTKSDHKAKHANHEAQKGTCDDCSLIPAHTKRTRLDLAFAPTSRAFFFQGQRRQISLILGRWLSSPERTCGRVVAAVPSRGCGAGTGTMYWWWLNKTGM